MPSCKTEKRTKRQKPYCNRQTKRQELYCSKTKKVAKRQEKNRGSKKKKSKY